MEKLIKFVYEDDNNTKVLRGYILKEDEFTYLIKAENTNKHIILGKRNIISAMEVS